MGIFKQMKIFLDDLRDLPFEFVTEGNWTVVRTADGCIRLIEDTGLENIEAISLDNDLGHAIEGFRVADYIEELVIEHGKPPVQRWYIHSHNHVRLQYMRDVFDRMNR